MAYNNKGNSPQEDEGVFSGAGEWARRGRTPMQGSYDPMTVPRSSIRTAGPSTMRRTDPNSSTIRPTQANFAQGQHIRGHVASRYGPVPAQNTQPHNSQPQLAAGLGPSYATVVSGSQQSRHQPRLNYPPSAPDQNLQHPTRIRPQPSAFSNGPPAINPFQYQPEQGRSYAQVVAAPAGQPPPRHPMPAGNQMLSPAQMVHPNQAYNGSYNPTLSNELPSAQPYMQTPSGPTPYNGYNDPYPNEPLLGSYPNDPPGVAPWEFDRNFDFSLFDNPIDRFLYEDDPYVVKDGLVVDPAAKPTHSQSLQSPVNSLDASSATSSMRRTKKEIMGGASGDHKCRHCGGGFRSSDDRRHHEDRVHLPYSARPFPCPRCDKRYIHQKDLNRHLATHGDRAANAQYFCRYRGCRYATEGFARKDHCARHMATHRKADSGIQMSRSTSAGTY